MEDKETVQEYLHMMLNAVLDSDSFFVILGDVENSAITFHSEDVPMEDVINIVEGSLWHVNEEHKHEFEDDTKEYWT